MIHRKLLGLVSSAAALASPSNPGLRRSVAGLAVTLGLLATAGPAGAMLYNGHAGLGSSVYQHNQTDLEFAVSPPGPGSDAVVDGTSNTLQTALVAHR